jgi:hypothetical protein
MSTVAPATSSANAAAFLLGQDAPNEAAPSTSAAPGFNVAPGDDRGPATNIVLSDKVKSILARATADQDVADRFKAFVDAQRPDGADGSSKGSGHSGAKRHDVNKAFAQLTAAAQAADSSDDLSPVKAEHDFSNGVQVDGFTLSVAARAKDGSFRTELVGPDGLSFFDFRFGQSGEVSGFGGLKPGMSAASYQRGNVEYITLTENDAAALSATVSTDAGTVTTSAAATHTSQITFAIDFTTGAIQATKADAWASSGSAQISPTLSRLA